MRKHIPVQEIAAGSTVFVVPRDSSTPRGPGLEFVPEAGTEVVVNDYIHGCIQRGALIAYEAKEYAPKELAEHYERLRTSLVPDDDEAAPGDADAEKENG